MNALFTSSTSLYALSLVSVLYGMITNYIVYIAGGYLIFKNLTAALFSLNEDAIYVLGLQHLN